MPADLVLALCALGDDFDARALYARCEPPARRSVRSDDLGADFVAGFDQTDLMCGGGAQVTGKAVGVEKVFDATGVVDFPLRSPVCPIRRSRIDLRGRPDAAFELAGERVGRSG